MSAIKADINVKARLRSCSEAIAIRYGTAFTKISAAPIPNSAVTQQQSRRPGRAGEATPHSRNKQGRVTNDDKTRDQAVAQPKARTDKTCGKRGKHPDDLPAPI